MLKLFMIGNQNQKKNRAHASLVRLLLLACPAPSTEVPLVSGGLLGLLLGFKSSAVVGRHECFRSSLNPGRQCFVGQTGGGSQTLQRSNAEWPVARFLRN